MKSHKFFRNATAEDRISDDQEVSGNEVFGDMISGIHGVQVKIVVSKFNKK